MYEQATIYSLATASALFAGRAVLDLALQARDKNAVNQRLKIRAQSDTLEQAVVELRRKKGLDENGDRVIKNAWFGRLIARSGLSYAPLMWTLSILLTSCVLGGVAFLYQGVIIALIVSVLTVCFGPYFLLNYLGNWREKKLTLQLPDAMDMIVRSLLAGYPVPTAIALVGREAPDPLGSEFGLMADEISYGSSLEMAAQKMAARTEHPDIKLFAAIVRLQARTGGNLADLLATNAATIRQRQKLRLKIKAASSEGRMSAIILTSTPFIMILVLHLISPSFYGDVIAEPVIKWGLAAAFLWMAIGNLVMRKMIAFKV